MILIKKVRRRALPQFFKNILNKNDDLPSFLSIIYLDEAITPEYIEAYENIIEYIKRF